MCYRHLADGLASPPAPRDRVAAHRSIDYTAIVTGIDFPMFALNITCVDLSAAMLLGDSTIY